jgi:hypothetical protein
MAIKNKTTETEVDVRDFVNSYVDNEIKRADSFQLIELMKKWSGFEPKCGGRQLLVLEGITINMQVAMKEILLS